MSKGWIQFAGLVSLSALAAGLLYLIAYTFNSAVAHMTPDGKVPIADAGLFATLLLSFQQTVGAIRSIWESQERTSLAENLSQSTPTQLAPQSAIDGARQAADAADDTANKIKDQGNA